MGLLRSKVKTENPRTLRSSHCKTAKKMILIASAIICLAGMSVTGASALPIGPVTLDFSSDVKAKLQLIIQLIGGGVGLWGVVNLLEGYGNDNPGAKSQGVKQVLAGAALIACGSLVDSISWI